MKKKLINKLSLNKETLGSLNANQMSDLKGGASNFSCHATCTCGTGDTGTTGQCATSDCGPAPTQQVTNPYTCVCQ